MEQLAFPSLEDTPEIDFQTLDLLPYGIIVVDEQGTVLFYNAREEQISRRPRQDTVGKNFFRDVAPCTQVQEFYGRFEEAMRTVGLVASFSFKFPFPGRPREVEISLSSFRKAESHLCLISVSDVTEKKALREHLMKAERLREVGEVAAGVAHNFNNLLTVIRGNAELTMLMLAESDLARQRVAKILKAADDGAEMVKRIRASSAHQEQTQDEPRAVVDLNQIVKDSIAFTEDYAKAAQDERGARVRFITELTAGALEVSVNASQMREVFTNLLRNGVDAIEGVGQISVSVRRDEERWGVAEVRDTGQGMSDEVREKLFHPLFTTKGERGTGLGLVTCYAIIKRHGGDIETESAVGVGSTFTVRLPLKH